MIIGASVVHNDLHVFSKLLESFEGLCDKLVIVDDGSSECTEKERHDLISKSFSKPFIFKRIEKSKKEYERRSMLWSMLCENSNRGDWIVLLDSDECYYNKELPELKELMLIHSNINYISTRLYNMWSETHYRVDGYWNPTYGIKRRIFRMFKDSVYRPDNFNPDTIECGEVPKYVFGLRGIDTGYKLLHLGYIRQEDRQRKYDFHKKVDAEGKFHLSSHINSIIQEPVLLELK